MPINQIDIQEEKSKSVSELLSDFMKHPWVSELLEWTFMYNEKSRIDGTPYNTTFFQQIWKCSYDEWKNWQITSQELLNRFFQAMDSWILELNWIKNILWNGNSDKAKSKLEKEGINYMILSIKTAKSAAPIELEKASSKPILSYKNRQKLVLEVEKWQEKLYWPKVSENKEEVIDSFLLLCEEFNKWKQYFTPGQELQFTNLYNKLKQKIIDIEKYRDITLPDLETYKSKEIIKHKETNEVIKKAENIDIPREIYMKIWQQYIDAMWLRQKVINNPEASSLYDWPDSLDVPVTIDYKELNLKEVLNLMIHEIGAHYANQTTSEKNGFQVRWAKNLNKEEWLAIIMEWLLEWKKLKDLREAGYSFPYILAGELLNKEERQLFVDLRIRMDIDTKWKYGDSQNKRDLRIMRGYPLDYKWTQRKDCSYWRWANQIIDFVQQKKGSIADLYKGKFSIEDIESGKLDKIISKENIVFPLLFPDMLIFLIANWRKNFTHAKFMDYLRDKYAWDIDEKDMNNITTIKEFSKLKIFITMWKEVETFLKDIK